jgi:hypothetical protein
VLWRRAGSRNPPGRDPEAPRSKLQQWAQLWPEPVDKLAYLIGFTLFLTALALMTGIDQHYALERTARMPSVVSSILFLEPLQTYTSMHEELANMTSRIRESASQMEEFAKMVPKCTWHEIDPAHGEQCKFNGLAHNVKADLAKTRFRSLELVGEEIKGLCKELATLQRGLEQRDADQQVVGQIVGELLGRRAAAALVRGFSISVWGHWLTL